MAVLLLTLATAALAQSGGQKGSSLRLLTGQVVTSSNAPVDKAIVYLKNTKAVGRKFNGLLNPDEEHRNSEWLKAGNDEKKLILDPGLHGVSKADREKRLLCQEFMDVAFEPVLELGRLIYEGDTGRLIVLGGRGRSGTPYRAAHQANSGRSSESGPRRYSDRSRSPGESRCSSRGSRSRRRLASAA